MLNSGAKQVVNFVVVAVCVRYCMPARVQNEQEALVSNKEDLSAKAHAFARQMPNKYFPLKSIHVRCGKSFDESPIFATIDYECAENLRHSTIVANRSRMFGNSDRKPIHQLLVCMLGAGRPRREC